MEGNAVMVILLVLKKYGRNNFRTARYPNSSFTIASKSK